VADDRRHRRPHCRLLAHPNYLAVAVELLAVPLIGGALVTAALATLGNVLLLAIRIPAEERALGLTWARAFGREPVAGGRPARLLAEVGDLAPGGSHPLLT
jgi:hypothetical protein